ncbi:ANTAR domain-containing response regulator [Amycolatopsis sp. FDAARGOS 1241]|uniref:ANTAR domain-containing response regulator n=1 Tax=Amycolatopsis sp. FDAARGOS 1241 TaxID=2778070 RepID=UPI001EF1FC45|nr:ANTAR domain-containing protein [Amycolatopsis sp. FDAARGOS 1241]
MRRSRGPRRAGRRCRTRPRQRAALATLGAGRHRTRHPRRHLHRPDPRPPQGPSVGALNVYSRTTNGLDKADRDALLLLATHASLALATTDAVTRAELEVAHLRKAIASRDVIGQAKGIIMARRGVSADEAFDLLRHTSQDLNIKLAELARTLTDRHTELDLPTH